MLRAPHQANGIQRRNRARQLAKRRGEQPSRQKPLGATSHILRPFDSQRSWYRYLSRMMKARKITTYLLRRHKKVMDDLRGFKPAVFDLPLVVTPSSYFANKH